MIRLLIILDLLGYISISWHMLVTPIIAGVILLIWLNKKIKSYKEFRYLMTLSKDKTLLFFMTKTCLRFKNMQENISRHYSKKKRKKYRTKRRRRD